MVINYIRELREVSEKESNPEYKQIYNKIIESLKGIITKEQEKDDAESKFEVDLGEKMKNTTENNRNA